METRRKDKVESSRVEKKNGQKKQRKLRKGVVKSETILEKTA